jgi:hypothetical protein
MSTTWQVPQLTSDRVLQQLLKEWQEVCGTRVQFHGMGCAIHRNESASHRRAGLEMSQYIPGKSERQLLLFADAVRPNTQRRFVLVLASR